MILAISATIGVLCAVVMATLVVTDRLAELMALVTVGYLVCLAIVVGVMAHILLSGVIG